LCTNLKLSLLDKNPISDVKLGNTYDAAVQEAHNAAQVINSDERMGSLLQRTN
jgi:hypothetical protein